MPPLCTQNGDICGGIFCFGKRAGAVGKTAVTTTQPHFPRRKIILRRKEKNVPYK
jgi:hypothetical protein